MFDLFIKNPLQGVWNSKVESTAWYKTKTFVNFNQQNTLLLNIEFNNLVMFSTSFELCSYKIMYL